MTRRESSSRWAARAFWLTLAFVLAGSVSGTGNVHGQSQAQDQARGRTLFAPGAQLDVPPGLDGSERLKKRGRRVRANVSLLAAGDVPAAEDVITVNLFDDVQVRAQRRGAVERPRPGGSVWKGQLLDLPGEAAFAVNGSVMAGTVFAGDRVFEIVYLGDGDHEVRELDPSAFPTDDPPIEHPDLSGEALADDVVAAGDSASQIDVMVLWTPSAASAAGGTAAIQSLIDLAVANTNTAYANSNVSQRLRLVYAAQISYTEGNATTDLNRLTSTSDGYLDQVHTLRNTHGADLVTLLGSGYVSSGTCGVGWLMTSNTTGFAGHGFSVVDRYCAASNLSYAHELGHNMGLHHDPANASGAGAYSYAYGYQEPSGLFRTVMAYACPSGSCPRLPRFSNPSLSYNGKVTGTSNHNNALALNNTASSVANFRQAVSGGCSYSLNTASTSVGSGAATGSLGVTAGSGCSWTSSSNAAWITITSGASGNGNGSVGFSVQANTAGTSRSGTLTVAGKTFTVTQAAATCGAFSLSPSSKNVAASGGSVSVSVSGTSGCSRTATSNAAWISVTSGASGTGSGTVGLSVAANTAGTSRTGTATVAGKTFAVIQAAATCSAFSLSPSSQSVAASGGSVSVSVGGTSGCSRTATSNAAWIAVTSGASGTGSGTVGLSVAANTAGTSRSGTATIGGRTFTVSQSAASCTQFTISPGSATVGASGGTVSVAVSGMSGCTRTASSNASWLTVTGGTSGTGSGTVTLSVAANAAGASRTGTATIAGRTFTVTEAAVACSYAISPSSASVAAGGGTGSFTLTTPSGCSASATKSASWITITGGATGSSSRTVSYSVAANTGNARSGSISVGGRTFSISQAKAAGNARKARNAAKADFNGDSMADLLWQHDTGAVGVWTMNNLSASGLVFLNSVDPAWRMVGSGDLNGDGKPEILWHHQTGGWLLAWFTDGQSVQQSTFLTPARLESGWSIAALADFNADAKADLVLQHADGRLGVWFMNGTTLLSTSYLNPYTIGTSGWRIAGAGDIDGDSKPDLLWQSGDGVVGAWMMDGTAAKSTVLLSPAQVGAGWNIRGMVDLNADDQLDVVWQHDNGIVGVWLMQGTAATTYQALQPGAVGAGWRLVGPR